MVSVSALSCESPTVPTERHTGGCEALGVPNRQICEPRSLW